MLTCFVAQVATSLASSTAHTQDPIGFPIFCLTDGVSVSCPALLIEGSENLNKVREGKHLSICCP